MPADPAPRRADDELLAAVHARADGVRQRRQHFRVLGIGAAAAITLVAGIGAAGADTNQTSSHPVQRAAKAPDDAVNTTADTTTTTETSTTPIPPATTTTAPTPATTTTTSTAASNAAGTASPVASRVRPTAQAFVFEVSPPNRDPGRIYISARGQATSGYVSRLILTWGESQARIFNYPSSACQAPGGSQTHDVEVADDNHVYSAPSAYMVRLTVLATSCDGTANDTASAAVQVTYPSPPPD